MILQETVQGKYVQCIVPSIVKVKDALRTEKHLKETENRLSTQFSLFSEYPNSTRILEFNC